MNKTEIDTENTPMVVLDGRGVGRLGEKGEGIRSTNWYLQNIHRDTA